MTINIDLKQKVVLMQLATNYIDPIPEEVEKFDSIREAIEFEINDTNHAAEICPDELVPFSKFIQKKYMEWENDNGNYWYGNDDDLVLIDNEADNKFIPLSQNCGGDYRYICFEDQL
jgi:hypothetical protein